MLQINIAQQKPLDSMIHWINTHHTIDSQYILTLHRISYRQSENDIRQSFAYYEKAAAYSDSINFTYGKALAQINLGILFSGSANFDASNKAYFKAIEYAEACGALRLQAISLNNIGENFKVLKDFTKSRQYAQEAILINTKLKAWRGVAINYELQQQCDLEEKLYANAKRNLVLGMPFANNAGDSYVLSQFYNGFGKLHAIKQQWDSASIYFDKAIAQAKVQDDARNEYNVYLAQVQYLKNMPPDDRIKILHTAIAIARKTGYFQGVSEAAQQMCFAYDEKHNRDSAQVYYLLYRNTADSLFSENNKRNVIIKETEWMIKRKEIENGHLKEFAVLQNKELGIKNSLLLLVVITLLLGIGIGFITYKSIQNKKKQTESQLKQKIAETQMEVLRAQMNPHFIFNSLNSIENFMMLNEKRLASDYLNKFTKLVRIILGSSMNELLTVAKDMEALQLYIDLQQLRFNNKFTYQTNIEPQLLAGDYKVPSLIVQPYVENAIEHGIAHSEKNNLSLTISAVLKDDSIIYTIEDNGIGRQQAARYNKQNKPNHKSVGLSITEDRIHLFNGSKSSEHDIEFADLFDENNQPGGTRVIVKIKLI
jgi:two-component sensor histidine kinase/tetratricopeptide (TPR) repeat protein